MYISYNKFNIYSKMFFKPLNEKLISVYYWFIIVLSLFQIFTGYHIIPLLNSFASPLLAWIFIPLGITILIGLSRKTKEGLKVAFAAQILFFVFLVIQLFVFSLNSFNNSGIIGQAVAAILHTLLNFSILLVLFRRLKLPTPLIKKNITRPNKQMTSKAEAPSSQFNFKIILQKVIIGLAAAIGWGTATNWVLLRFFTDSPSDLQFIGLGAIVYVFTFLIAGILGAIVSTLLFSLFLSHKNFKGNSLQSTIISIFLILPLGALMIYPLFWLLQLFIGHPYVYYPNYESFLPIFPSLMFVIALNLLPFFLGYSFLYKKRLPALIGLILILVSAGYFVISYQAFDAEAQKKC